MFNPGDKVVCVDGVQRRLTLGKVYTVKIRSLRDFVSVVDDMGEPTSWFEFRFKKVETQMKYEDWQLAKQGVTIPENSITLPGPDGSIVAFKAPIAPKVVTLKRLLKLDAFTFNTIGMGHGSKEYDHILSFDKVDGVIDCSSVKLEPRDV